MTTNRRTFLASLFAAPVAAAVSFKPQPNPRAAFTVLIRCDTSAFVAELDRCLAVMASLECASVIAAARQRLSETPIILSMDGREIDRLYIDVSDLLASSAHAART